MYLHELFDEQVVRAPDALAAVLRGSTTQLSRAPPACATSSIITSEILGWVQRSQSDCVSSDRSSSSLGLLGILKAGGAYLPLDPEVSRLKRMASMLDDARVPILVTQQHFLGLGFRIFSQPAPSV